ncbi:hypothetical protein IV102_11925 [bacterium]|nr:hypothetical protein [bacterium]
MNVLRATSLLEVLLATSLLLVVGLVTGILYRNTLGTIQFTVSRSDTKQILRQALARLSPLLKTAYIPSLAGANTCYETPLAPYPSGVDPADPLSPSGSGTNSFLFYTPVDLLNVNAVLLPVADQQIHLFEIRLQEAVDPEPSGAGLILRSLVVQERTVPARFGLSPFALLSGRSRVLARHLSDLRFSRVSTIGLQLRIEAQAVQRTLTARGQGIMTNRLEGKIFFPVLCQ